MAHILNEKKRFAEKIAVLDHLPGLVGMTNSPANVDWDPDTFHQYVEKSARAWTRPSREAALAHAKFILYWIAGARAPIEEVVTSVMVLWGYMEVHKAFIINDEFYGTGAVPASTQIEAPNADAWKFASQVEMTGVNAALKEGMSALSAVTAKRWYEAVLASLGANDTKREDMTIMYLGYYMMNLFRLTTKDHATMTAHYYNNVNKTFSSLFSPNPLWVSAFSPCPPPDYERMTDWRSFVERTSPGCWLIATPLVYSYCLSKDHRVKSVLKAACLLSVSYTGLSVLSWKMRAQEGLNIDTPTLFKFMAFSRYMRFIETYIDHQRKYPDNGAGTNLTWVFCRLYNEEALSKFSVRQFGEETALFVALCDQNANAEAPIWNAQHLQNISLGVKTHAIAMARSIICALSQSITKQPLSEAAMLTAECMKKVQDTPVQPFRQQAPEDPPYYEI